MYAADAARHTIQEETHNAPRKNCRETVVFVSGSSVNDSGATKKRIGNQRSDEGPMAGLRERKKARLRQQIVETALHLFPPARLREHPHRRHCADAGNQPATFFAISPAKMRYCAKWGAVRLLAKPKA